VARADAAERDGSSGIRAVAAGAQSRALTAAVRPVVATAWRVIDQAKHLGDGMSMTKRERGSRAGSVRAGAGAGSGTTQTLGADGRRRVNCRS